MKKIRIFALAVAMFFASSVVALATMPVVKCGGCYNNIDDCCCKRYYDEIIHKFLVDLDNGKQPGGVGFEYSIFSEMTKPI